MSLCNTIETVSEENKTEYGQNDVSSEKGCSYNETDVDPDENGKEEQEKLPIEERENEIVSLHALQKIINEKASCKRWGRNFSIIEEIIFHIKCLFSCGTSNALIICENLTFYWDNKWLLKMRNTLK